MSMRWVVQRMSYYELGEEDLPVGKCHHFLWRERDLLPNIIWSQNELVLIRAIGNGLRFALVGRG